MGFSSRSDNVSVIHSSLHIFQDISICSSHHAGLQGEVRGAAMVGARLADVTCVEVVLHR